MSKTLKLGIDCDGVLANFTAEVVKAANSLWPGKMPLDYEPDNWDYQGVLTKDEWKQIWTALLQVENLWLNEKDLPGVAELQKFLKKRPLAEIYFITSRAETKGMSVLVQTTQWLESRGLWSRFCRSTVIPVHKPDEKKQILIDFKIPFMLDDHAPTIAELQGIPGLQAYVLDAAYNRYAAHLPRVSSVAEYLKKVEVSCE